MLKPECTSIPGTVTSPQLSDYRGVNANMHAVEALLAAADVVGDHGLREAGSRSQLAE